MHRRSGVVGFIASFEDHKLHYLVLENCSHGDLFKELMLAGGRMMEKRAVNEVQRRPLGSIATATRQMLGTFLRAPSQSVFQDSTSICERSPF